MEIKQILVVEDGPADFLRLAKLLEVAFQPNEITHAENIERTYQITQEKKFDLVFVDLGLPDGSGIDVVGSLSKLSPPMPCVVMSSLSHEELIVQAIENGAIGYLLKSLDREQILYQLNNLLHGGAAIDPSVARIILQRFRTAAAKKSPLTVESMSDVNSDTQKNLLTAREVELLNYVARGFSNREVAQHMGLTVNSVESYAKEIYRKLEVHSRTEAVFEARALGLLNS